MVKFVKSISERGMFIRILNMIMFIEKAQEKSESE